MDIMCGEVALSLYACGIICCVLLFTALPMQVKKKNILAMFANTADWAHTPREWLPHHHDAATKIQARQQGRVARAAPQGGKDCTAGWQLRQGLRLESTSSSP